MKGSFGMFCRNADLVKLLVLDLYLNHRYSLYIESVCYHIYRISLLLIFCTLQSWRKIFFIIYLCSSVPAWLYMRAAR